MYCFFHLSGLLDTIKIDKWKISIYILHQRNSDKKNLTLIFWSKYQDLAGMVMGFLREIILWENKNDIDGWNDLGFNNEVYHMD